MSAGGRPRPFLGATWTEKERKAVVKSRLNACLVPLHALAQDVHPECATFPVPSPLLSLARMRESSRRPGSVPRPRLVSDALASRPHPEVPVHVLQANLFPPDVLDDLLSEEAAAARLGRIGAGGLLRPSTDRAIDAMREDFRD